MPSMAIVDVNKTASLNERTAMFTVRDGRPTITKLDHRSIELADHTRLFSRRLTWSEIGPRQRGS